MQKAIDVSPDESAAVHKVVAQSVKSCSSVTGDCVLFLET